MGEIFSKDYMVESVNTDMYGLCKPSSLLSFMQDAANGHVRVLGMSRAMLIERFGAAWVMARMRYWLFKPVVAGPLTVTTWHRPPKASYVYRDFGLSVNGEPVGKAVTMWAVMYMETRKSARLNCVGITEASRPYAACYTEELSKPRSPEGLCEHEVRLMRYSDSDINGHINNARYADFACDAADAHLLKGCYINGMQINFGAECFPGETIRICRAKLPDGVFVEGSVDGKTRFEAIVYIDSPA